MKMCLYQFLNQCPKCKHDMDTNHHPNNTDCVWFIPVTINFVEVKEDSEVPDVRSDKV